MSEEQGVTTMARTTTVGNTTTTSDTELSGDVGSQHLPIYDFAKMSAVDWDKVYEGPMNQLQFISWNGLNIARLALSIWILASHLALVLLILGKAELRRQPKNVLIIGVSLTNMLMGAFLVPAKLHFILGSGEVAAADCGLSMGWTLLNDYYQVCVALLAVFGLVLERLVYVYTERRGTLLTRCATWINCALYFLLPWVLAAILLVPIFHEALVAPVLGQDCAFRVREHYFLVMEILSFVPAGFAVFITAPLAGLLDCLRSDTCTYTPSTPRGESLVIAVLVSVLSVFCEAPYFVTRMLIMCMECNNPFCFSFNEGLTAGMWLRIVKASLMPFLWLVYSDVRAALLCRFQYKKVKAAHDDEDEDDYRLVNTRM